MLPTKKETRVFFRDRLMAFLFGIMVFVGLLTIVSVVTRVQSSDLQVPVLYTEYALTLERGNWLVLYEYVLFIMIVGAVNSLIAIKARVLNRSYGTTILLLTIIIFLIALLVSNSIIGLLVV